MGRNCILEVCHTTPPFRQDCLETDTHEAHTTEDHRYLLFFPCLLLDRKTERKRIDDLYGRIHDFFLGDCWAASPIFWDGPGVLGGGTIAPNISLFAGTQPVSSAQNLQLDPWTHLFKSKPKGTGKRGYRKCRSVLQDWKLRRRGGGNDVYGLRGSRTVGWMCCHIVGSAGGSIPDRMGSIMMACRPTERTDENHNSAGGGSSLPRRDRTSLSWVAFTEPPTGL